MTDERRRGTQAIDRTLDLMHRLASRGEIGWRLTDLAEQCGLEVPTVHRMLRALIDHDWVRQRPDRRYVLGLTVFQMALAMPAQQAFRAACEPEVRALATRHDVIAFLSLLTGDDFFVIDRCGESSMHVLADVGTRRPLAASALGAAMLVTMPPAQQREVLARNRPRIEQAEGPRISRYLRMVRDSRRAGHATNLGTVIPGLGSIGLPIRDATGRAFGSLAVMGRLDQFGPASTARMLASIRQAVERIERLQAGLIARLTIGPSGSCHSIGSSR